MAEFTEVMKQRKRMHNFYVKNSACSKCPLSSVNNGIDEHCDFFIKYNSEEAEKLIMKWAEEHPIKTNADKFMEVFGVKLDFVEISKCVGGCIFECDKSSCGGCNKKGFWEQEYKEPKE